MPVHLQAGSQEDVYKFMPWRAPGTAIPADPCGVAGGDQHGVKQTAGGEYFATKHAKLGDHGSKARRLAPKWQSIHAVTGVLQNSTTNAGTKRHKLWHRSNATGTNVLYQHLLLKSEALRLQRASSGVSTHRIRARPQQKHLLPGVLAALCHAPRAMPSACPPVRGRACVAAGTQAVLLRRQLDGGQRGRGTPKHPPCSPAVLCCARLGRLLPSAHGPHAVRCACAAAVEPSSRLLCARGSMTRACAAGRAAARAGSTLRMRPARGRACLAALLRRLLCAVHGWRQASWYIQANHAGGYYFRLCPASEALSEECFQRTPVPFEGAQTTLRMRHAPPPSLSCPLSSCLLPPVPVLALGGCAPWGGGACTAAPRACWEGDGALPRLASQRGGTAPAGALHRSGRESVINATFLREGTTPRGSVWKMNPVPECCPGASDSEAGACEKLGYTCGSYVKDATGTSSRAPRGPAPAPAPPSTSTQHPFTQHHPAAPQCFQPVLSACGNRLGEIHPLIS